MKTLTDTHSGLRILKDRSALSILRQAAPVVCHGILVHLAPQRKNKSSEFVLNLEMELTTVMFYRGFSDDWQVASVRGDPFGVDSSGNHYMCS